MMQLTNAQVALQAASDSAADSMQTSTILGRAREFKEWLDENTPYEEIP